MSTEKIKDLLHKQVEQGDDMLLKMMYLLVKGYQQGMIKNEGQEIRKYTANKGLIYQLSRIENAAKN